MKRMVLLWLGGLFLGAALLLLPVLSARAQGGTPYPGQPTTAAPPTNYPAPGTNTPPPTSGFPTATRFATPVVPRTPTLFQTSTQPSGVTPTLERTPLPPTPTGPTPTLIPLPEITIQFPHGGEDGLLSIQHPPGSPALPKGAAGLSDRRLRQIFLGVLFLIWVVLGVWFFIAQRRINRSTPPE